MSDIAVGRRRAGWRERLGAAEAVPARPDTRRMLQLGLAAIWLLDGVLQYQSFMYTRAFTQMIGATSDGNPGVVARPINWNAASGPASPGPAEHALRHHPAAARPGHRLPAHGPAGAGRLDRLVARGLVVRRGPRRGAERRGEPAERRPRRGDHLRAAGRAALAGRPDHGLRGTGPVRGRPGRRGQRGPRPVGRALGQPGLLRADPGQPRPHGAARHGGRHDRRRARLAGRAGLAARPRCSGTAGWPPRSGWPSPSSSSRSGSSCRRPRPGPR